MIKIEPWQKAIIDYIVMNPTANISINDLYKMLWKKNLRTRKKDIKNFLESKLFEELLSEAYQDKQMVIARFLPETIRNLKTLLNSEDEKIRLEASKMILKYIELLDEKKTQKSKSKLSPVGLPVTLEENDIIIKKLTED